MRPSYWVDSAALSLLKQKRGAQVAWGEWLAGFRWQIYVVLTSASPHPTFERFQWEVHHWLEELRRSGCPRLNAFISCDRGKGGDRRLNAHVLIGGVFQGKPPPPGLHRTLAITLALKMAKRLWTHGQVRKCEPYNTRGAVPDYLARHCNDGELVGEVWGQPIRKSKQRQRRRQQQTIRKD